MNTNPTTNLETIVKYARLIEGTDDMPSLENYFSKLTNGMQNMAEHTVGGLVTSLKNFSISRPTSTLKKHDLKQALSNGTPYITVAGAIVTRPSNFKGNLSTFAGMYLPGSQKLTEEYLPLLEGYQSHLVNAARKESETYSSHPAYMARYLKEERKFNSNAMPYFKGGARDITTILDMLPNESACISFAELVTQFENHPLLQLSFLQDLEGRLSVAATVLSNFKRDNSDNKKLYKALARDAFSLAEIANTLVGRAYTLQQLLKVYDEVVTVIIDGNK